MTDFREFIQTLTRQLALPLPGADAQRQMVPPTRKIMPEKNAYSGKPKRSAVLILFYPVAKVPYFVLIERAVYQGVHSGQIAFPGGQYDPKDKNLQTTALREAQEEININPKQVKVIGRLTPVYIPPSHFDVYPFVGYYPSKPPLKADHTETERILEIRLSDFLHPENQTVKTIRHRTGKTIEVPCFYLNHKIVWGATAMILSELYTLLNRS